MVDTKIARFEAQDLDRLRPEKLFDLSGRVALVTGAGGGLGEWLSAGLAGAGAHVVLSDHPRMELAGLVAAIEEGGGSAEVITSDLLEEDAPRRLIDQVLERCDRIDVLLNNAGANRREPIFEVSPESWDLISAMNLKVPFELSRYAAESMVEGDGGSIVHIGSLNNAIGLEGVAVYGAAKAGLCQLAKSMSVEWASSGVRINAICPGFMLTPLSKPLWDDTERGPWILERSLLRRPGYPRELIGTLLLMASDAGSFLTGQAIYVDGGWLAGTPWSAEGRAEVAQ